MTISAQDVLSFEGIVILVLVVIIIFLLGIVFGMVISHRRTVL